MVCTDMSEQKKNLDIFAIVIAAVITVLLIAVITVIILLSRIVKK